MTYPSLQQIASDLHSEINKQLAEMPRLKSKLDEAKARFQASPYADAVECSECGGAGRYMVNFSVGYDEYDSETEFCDHCLMDGVYPWDVNRSWFDEEAAKASLDPTLDEEEREEALQDLLRDQAWDVEVEAPQVIKDYKSAYYEYKSAPYGLYQELDMLKFHCEEQGYGEVDKEWLDTTMDKISEIIESNETIKL